MKHTFDQEIDMRKKIEDIVSLARQAASAGRHPLTTVYLLRSTPSPPKGVARVGGDPVGVTPEAWPVFDDDPLDHLLTLDLEEMPDLRTGPLAEARAVSVFVSDRIMNEAFMPGTEEAAVLALSADEVDRGVLPAPRAAVVPARELEVVAIEVPTAVFEEDAAPDHRDLEPLGSALVNAPAYAGGRPFWLQDPEHDGHFLMQFDEGFIDMNLGDAGVMFVFADTAFWQCH